MKFYYTGGFVCYRRYSLKPEEKKKFYNIVCRPSVMARVRL